MTTKFADIVDRRLSRRRLLQGMAGTGVGIAALATGLGGCTTLGLARSKSTTLGFADIPQTIMDGDRVAAGYRVEPLVRWGDAVAGDAPAFAPAALTSAAQAKQFGYNNDFMAFFPLPRGSGASDHGLLFVNHEYTNGELMFANYAPDTQTEAQTAVEIAAHGASIIEVKREAAGWRVVEGSAYARRITGATPIALSGPAAGHRRLVTRADRTGRRVLGTLNNCSGGQTPWGTALSGEENIDQYFNGPALDKLPAKRADHLKIMGIGDGPARSWHRSERRFDYGFEPNESNRFGWVLEVDPYEPDAMPIKRTALGRFKHEAATCVVAPDGRVVVYMGDDEPNQFLYRFVSRDAVDLKDSGANKSLLDHGTLSVARFTDEKLDWLPVVFGMGPLTAQNGFRSQGDVLVETRRAAALLGATPMDRPEDVETDPVTGRVYVVLTNNRRRKPEAVDGPNPRAANEHGQILELVPPTTAGALDPAADSFSWEIFLLAGDPASGARYGEGTEVWLSSPDNIAFDPKGRLWIASDQGSRQAKNNIPDGMFACDVSGEGRAQLHFFYAVPRGAECCGPTFTPDGKTLFVAVQHPGEGERSKETGFASTFEKPSTRWPDFKPDVPPRPTVVAITKIDGGEIGS